MLSIRVCSVGVKRCWALGLAGSRDPALPPTQALYKSTRPVVRSVRVRLCTLTFHGNARLHPNTPHACVRLGSGTRRGTSCIVMHRFSAEKKLVLVEFLFESTVYRKGT